VTADDARAAAALHADAAVVEPLRRLLPGAPEALAAMAAIAARRSYAAGEHLLRGGERAELSFLVISGLARELYLTDSGVEHTRGFVAEGQLTGSLRDLLSGGPSVTWIEAIEPTEVIAWRYRDFDRLCDRHPALERAARRTAEALYVRKARREHDMLALSAAERYRQWCAEHAAIDGRITRRHLASYLGVTPEHLSRLRAARARPPAR
jgi:CRP-like cAMP-binding protein